MPRIFRRSKDKDEDKPAESGHGITEYSPEIKAQELPEDPFGAVVPDVSGVKLPKGTKPKGSLSKFAWKLLDSVGEGNAIFSPYGIYMALGMLANGAEKGSETEEELLDALGSDSPDSLNAYLDSLLVSVEESGNVRFDSNSLVIVNSSEFLKLRISEDYSAKVARYCRGAIAEADISGDLSGVKRKIKEWVNLKTSGMIPNYESSISKGVLCDLLNVVYFKGTWMFKFQKRDTWDKNFRNDDGSVSKVKMMHKKLAFATYLDDGRYRALEVPYSSLDVRMCLILPEDEDSLDVLSSWRSETLEYRDSFVRKLGKSPPTHVELSLPRFTMSANYDLGRIMRTLGIAGVLGGDARFTEMLEGTQLFFDSGTHQAKVKVNEEGTEAAAVTEVMVLGSCLPREEPKRIVFRCDIPFIFTILDGDDNNCLFMGYAGNGRAFSDLS